MFERLKGGLIPTFDPTRHVHICDGATYSFDVTWLRRRFGVSYETPTSPRWVRRARAREAARLAALSVAALAKVDPGFGPAPGAMDWTTEQEERASGLPSAMPDDYQDPGLTAALLADEQDAAAAQREDHHA